MLIDRIIYPIHALGPGKRAVIWTVGCRKSCDNCSNPELRFFDSSKEMSLQTFSKVIRRFEDTRPDGFTITGGEPFCQPEELYYYMQVMRKYADDILIFSGYSEPELTKLGRTDPFIDRCRSLASVLILGEYREEYNDNKTALLASGNQEIIFVEERFREPYEAYMKAGRRIENVFYKNELISVGIHNKKECEPDEGA